MANSGAEAITGQPSPLRGEGGAQRRVRGSVSLARSLCRNETDAEAKLWEILRARRLGGLKFVRQFPIGPYFADFACREAALVVEADGSQHDGSRHDESRTEFLTKEGYSVQRFWNTDILLHPHSVAEQILAAVGLHPSPGDRFAAATLSPEGRGSKGASAATTQKRSRHLTGGVARLTSE